MTNGIATIRVYLSSTWKDLKPERAAVEKAINSLSETKFVGMEYFGSRDETTRQASLDAIEGCSLYVVIIGERYGSGITEAEYDRAHQFGIPCHVYCKRKRSGTTAGGESAQKRKELRRFVEKLRDQTTGHLVSEFSTADELARRVVIDLHNWSITRSAQALNSDDPLAGLPSALLRAIMDPYPGLRDEVYPEFGDKVGQLTQSFVGRTSVFEKISQFTEKFSCGYFQIVGGAGLGKTALAAEIARRFAAPIFFGSISDAHTHANQCLRHLCTELILRRGLPYQRLPDRAGTDASFLVEILTQAPKSHAQPIWLVVDALDEADKPNIGQNAFLLPPHLPENVYCAVTRRDDIELIVAPSTGLGSASLAAETEEQTRDIHDYLLGQVRRPDLQWALNIEPRIDADEFVTALADASHGNFKYIEYSLADLAARKAGGAPFDLTRLPKGLTDYYREFWDRMASVKDEDWQDWINFYKPTIALLAVAGEPVSLEWLAAQINRDPEEIRDRALSRWRRFLALTERNGTERWSIVHKSFADYLKEGNRVSLKEFHRQVAQYFLSAERWQACEGYALRHLARHLGESNSSEDLFALLDNEQWYQMQIGADATASTFLVGVSQAWDHAVTLNRAAVEANSSPKYLARELSCGLMTATMRTVAGNLPAPLIAALITSGKWTIEQALQSVDRSTSPLSQVRALVAIAGQASGPRKRDLIDQALAVANKIEPDHKETPDDKTLALLAVEPALPAEARTTLFATVLEGIPSMPHIPDAVGFLRALVERLPKDKSLLKTALKVGEELVDSGYDLPLLRIAADLGPTVYKQVIQKGLRLARKADTESSTRDGWRLSFLPHLSARERKQVITKEIERAASHLDSGSFYAGLLRNLEGDDRPPVIAAAHAAVVAAEYHWWRADILAEILPALESDKPARDQLIAAALNDSPETPDDYGWAKLCLTLTPYVETAKRRKLFGEGIDALERAKDAELTRKYAECADEETSPRLVSVAEAITNGTLRSEALAALLPVLPEHLRGTVIDKAQAAAWLIGDETARVQLLAAIIERCPPTGKPLIVAPALATAEQISKPEERAGALTTLLAVIDDQERPVVLEKAFAAAKQIDGGWIMRPMRLAGLLEYLKQPQLSEALDLLHNDLIAEGHPIHDARFESDVLPKLFPFVGVNEPFAEKLLAAIEHVEDQLNLIDIQAALLPHLNASMRAREQRKLVDYVHGMEPGGDRQRALTTIITCVDESLRPDLITEALASAPQCENAAQEVFAAITYCLPYWIKTCPTCWRQALNAVESLDRTEDRAWMLSYLIDYLPSEEKRAAITEARRAASKMKNKEYKAAILRKLVTHFSGDAKVDLFSEAVAAAQQADPVTGALSLALLVKDDSDDHRSESVKLALSAARNSEIAYYNSLALESLFPFLDDTTLLDEAVEMSLNFDLESERSKLIADLVKETMKRDKSLQYYLWRRLYRRLATKPRDELMSGLLPLVPLIESLGGTEAIADSGRAVVRSAAQWQ